jgi:MFS family permease
MGHRALFLLRARMSGAHAENLPVAPLVLHAVIATALAFVARASLPLDAGSFGYATAMLTALAALVALPLLGEFSHLLRADAAEEWVAALPVTARDLRVARALHIGIVLAWLALGSLLPAVALMPSGGIAARAGLAVGGMGLVVAIAGALFGAQALLGERAEAGLVALQTLLFAGAVIGFVMGPAAFPALAAVGALGDAAWTWAWPPAWFADPFGGSLVAAGMPLAAALAGGAALVLAPPAPHARAARRAPILARLLRPLRSAANRGWVRRDERAVFDLVFDALPLEREVVLRTYPLVGVPIAFLVIGASGASAVTRTDLLAVLFFTACIYLPVLLMHVPASESHRAKWLLSTHPIPAGALANGVIKAIAVRFLVPLYAALGAIGWVQAGPAIVPRLALPGLLISLAVLRMIYPSTVRDLPLSVPPDEVESKYDWGGVLLAIGMGLTVAAVLVNRLLPGVVHGLALTGVLLAVELAADRRTRIVRV